MRLNSRRFARNFQAVGRRLAIMSLTVMLAGHMGGCLNNQKGVGSVGDSEKTKTEKKVKGQGTLFVKAPIDSLKVKPKRAVEGIRAKNDTLSKADSLVQRIIETREKNIEIGVNPITPSDKKKRIIR